MIRSKFWAVLAAVFLTNFSMHTVWAAEHDARLASDVDQTSNIKPYVEPVMPAGFFPKWKDKRAYAGGIVDYYLVKNPKSLDGNIPLFITTMIYFEYLIDQLTKPNNHDLESDRKAKLAAMRDGVREKIGIRIDASTTEAIAALDAVLKLEQLGALGQHVTTDSDPVGPLENESVQAENGAKAGGFNASALANLDVQQLRQLTSSIEASGLDLANIFSVADAINQFSDINGLGFDVGDVAGALGISENDLGGMSFADAVDSYNEAYGTDYSVEQAKSELGID